MTDDGRPSDAGAPKSARPVLGSEPLGEQAAREFPLPDCLPVLPTRQFVMYPHLLLPVVLSAERDMRLINDVLIRDRLVACVAPSALDVETPGPEHLYRFGCATAVLKMLKFPDGAQRLFIQGLSRVRIRGFVQTEPYLVAEIERVESRLDMTDEVAALRLSVIGQFQKLVALSPNLPDELGVAVLNMDDTSRLCDVVSSGLNLNLAQRQEILEELDVARRLRMVLGHLGRDVQVLELSNRIQSSVREQMDKGQRDFLLRQQMKAIQEELGEGDAQAADVKGLRETLDKAGLPEEARKEADRELDRLARMNPAAAEYSVARTYLDWMVALPWGRSTEDRLDVDAVQRVLDEDHDGLDKVKRRIVEYVAVRKLKKDMRGPILCFVGPPGTGKTSLGRSISRAIGRRFVRLSLGGVRDEAEIRGHRRTYVGALPGRIIQGLRKAGSNNPVFMLDEVDKLGADFHGDPSAALLEVLDPEQNFSFSDHYLDVPFDLSRVMFITTANVLDTVPPALRDRMEVLELPGYTEEEKLAIARNHLAPRQLDAHGLGPAEVVFSDEALLALMRDYTREAGLRNLEREMGSLCRRVAAEKARRGSMPGPRVLSVADLREALGPARFFSEVAEGFSEPGVAVGLAWTPAGGDIIFVEATRMAGAGNLTLTGHLGKVMQESAQAAMSYVRSHAGDIGLDPRVFARTDVHLHVPAGALPKDGPSAGVTMAMALVSMFTGRPLRPDAAMTGEITLRGRVMPVGGIKEKVLAARRAGIKTVVMPALNRKDLGDVPESARKDMEFLFVERVEDLAARVFQESAPADGASVGRRGETPRRRKARTE